MIFGKVDLIPETPQGFLAALQTAGPTVVLPFSSPETATGLGMVEEGRSQDLLPGDLDNVSLALELQLAQN